ncbi:MAG: hypothetical protein IJM32_06065 [Ruminococcus sp.]|nr:hypothetical protein [Ruminococcus sp.]
MIIDGKRAVAYFDILGFKKRIENTPLQKLSSEYEKIITQTDGRFYVKDGKIERQELCYRYIFSDSIFLIAKNDTNESFIDMISYAWRMMQMFIVSGFNLRGAVTYGELYANIDTKVFVGQSIVDAVILEGKQDWMGAVVDNSVIERYGSFFDDNDIQSNVLRVILPIHDVAFKDGQRKNYHVINWRVNIVSEVGIKYFFNNDENDEHVKTKIDNTLRFSKEVVENGLFNFDDRIIPERYRKLYVGHGLPDPHNPFQGLNDGY